MKLWIRFLATFTLFIFTAAISNAQHPSHAEHQQKAKSEQKDQHSHDRHAEEVNKRGDKVMGFSHTKTTHHFRLKTDGGSIEVTANETNDTASRDQIRTHLKHIAQKFAAGDFTAPMLIHSQTPPGVPAMQRLKTEITYRYEEIERGAQVRISANNPEAIAAIHEFLRFQIQDHKTGDSTEVNQEPK
jgi:hypothetical protein